MNHILCRIISFFIGYAFGNISPGLIIAKIYKVDLRGSGSGNVGSTNVARTISFKVGLITLFCDCLKGLIPGLIAWAIFKNSPDTDPMLFAAYAAFGAVMGHMFPVALGFKGGKGIATSLAFIIICNPYGVIVALIAFFVPVVITRYVSLGSLICTIAVPLFYVLVAVFGWFSVLESGPRWEMAVMFIIDGIIVAFKHRSNLGRLIRGEESKFTIKKSEKKK